MIDNGHSWPSVQGYTLSEIGVFLKVIVKKEALQRAENISQFWLGANLQYKGLQEVLKDIREQANPPSPEEKHQKIQNDWMKLASISQR